MRKSIAIAAIIAAASTGLIIGCQEKVAPNEAAAPAAMPAAAPAATASPTLLKPVAGISDIMAIEGCDCVLAVSEDLPARAEFGVALARKAALTS